MSEFRRAPVLRKQLNGSWGLCCTDKREKKLSINQFKPNKWLNSIKVANLLFKRKNQGKITTISAAAAVRELRMRCWRRLFHFIYWSFKFKKVLKHFFNMIYVDFYLFYLKISRKTLKVVLQSSGPASGWPSGVHWGGWPVGRVSFFCFNLTVNNKFLSFLLQNKYKLLLLSALFPHFFPQIA